MKNSKKKFRFKSSSKIKNKNVKIVSMTCKKQHFVQQINLFAIQILINEIF